MSVEKLACIADWNHGPLTSVAEEKPHNPFFDFRFSSG
jgi:hypothetical protein